jgi:hypothetical protein
MESNSPIVNMTEKKDQRGLAIASLVLGLISLCAWFIPLCGGPIALAGLVTGYMGKESSQRTLAIAGLVTSALGMLGTLINAAYGAYLGITGQGFQF